MGVAAQLAARVRERRTDAEFWLSLLVYSATCVAFFPFSRWVASHAIDQGRLLHALLVLVFAGALIAADRQRQPPVELRLNRPAIVCLGLAYALLAAAMGTSWNLWVIPAYCLALGSFGLFVFGARVARLAGAILTAFAALLALAAWMPALDWPLRGIAGKWSSQALRLLGQETELGLAMIDQAPKLILAVNDRPFHVAAECNGFGVLSASLLVGILLSLYRKRNTFESLVNVAAAGVLGLAFNIARIVAIVLLAPLLPGNYAIMHEAVGTAAFWGCLIVVWWLLRGPALAGPRRSPSPAQASC